MDIMKTMEMMSRYPALQSYGCMGKNDGNSDSFYQPGKLAKNGFIERINRTYREEGLDMYMFNSLLDEARKITVD